MFDSEKPNNRLLNLNRKISLLSIQFTDNPTKYTMRSRKRISYTDECMEGKKIQLLSFHEPPI